MRGYERVRSRLPEQQRHAVRRDGCRQRWLARANSRESAEVEVIPHRRGSVPGSGAMMEEHDDDGGKRGGRGMFVAPLVQDPEAVAQELPPGNP